MDDLLLHARDLGRRIRESEAYRALRDAEAEVAASPDSLRLAQAIGAIQQEHAEAAAEGRTVPEETLVRHRKVAAAVETDERLGALRTAQQRFQEVVDGVRRAMLAELDMGEAGDGDGDSDAGGDADGA